MKFRYQQILNVLSLLLFIIVFFTFTPKPTTNILIMPASYAFIIWVPIFLLLFIWIVTPSTFTEKEIYTEIGYWLPVNLLFSTTGYVIKTPISLLFTIASLITIIMMYRTISKHHDFHFFFRLPFSIYLSWMCVETIVNSAVTLKFFHLSSLFGLSETTNAIIILILGSIFGTVLGVTTKDYVIPSVFIWGYVAIASNQHTSEQIEMTSMFGIAALGFCLFSFFKPSADGFLET